MRNNKREMKVKAGQKYDIQLDYMQLADGATLQFNVETIEPTTPAEVVAKAPTPTW